MKGHLVFLLLSASLLAQYCAAHYVPGNVEFSDRNELYSHVLGDYKAFVSDSLKASKPHLTRTQAAIAGMADLSQSIHRLNASIPLLLGEIDIVLNRAAEPGAKVTSILKPMVNCLEHVFMFRWHFVQEGDSEAFELLKQNGVDEFFASYKTLTDDFLVKFEATLQSYIDHLSEAEKVKEAEIIQWYQEYKTTDAKMRVDKFREFFQKFSPGDL